MNERQITILNDIPASKFHDKKRDDKIGLHIHISRVSINRVQFIAMVQSRLWIYYMHFRQRIFDSTYHMADP